MERITRKMLDRQLESVCKKLGVPYGHYEKCEPGTGTLGESKNFKTIPGGFSIDSLGHGCGNVTYRVEAIDQNGGTGVFCPMGESRYSARELFDVLYAIKELWFKGYLECGNKCSCKKEARHE